MSVPRQGLTLALVGNPNTGKSTFFNAWTGLRQVTGNWPGVTVEKHLGQTTLRDGTPATIVDLPGIYSLLAVSEDERVASDYARGPEPDLLVNVVDAVNLDRNLYLTLALMELGKPMVVVLTMTDILKRQGFALDVGALSRRLGVPVVTGDVQRRAARTALDHAIHDALATRRRPLHATYPQPVLDALATLRRADEPGFMAIHRLEGVLPGGEAQIAAFERAQGITPDVLIADARYNAIAAAVAGVRRETGRIHAEFGRALDRLVLNRWLGIPIFLAVMYLLFWFTQVVGGCFIDLMSGQYRINPLEPKVWDVGGEGEPEPDAPLAFRQKTRLSQHISFLKDFFRSYKDFADRHIDTIELMLERLYRSFGLNDHTDFSTLTPTDYPILSDLYDVIEDAYQHYDREENPLYPKELLREILLGLHSMCRGAESKFFNGPTNITSFRFLVFGVKGLLQANSSVKNAMLFNVLSFFSDKLLTEGNTVATLDELYIWLSNLTAVEYIRNSLKRVRKKESALILASQNLEDFDQPGIRELTRPLFAIPTHQFLFNAGSVDKRFYMENLQLEPSEFELIRYPQRGVCLYKCGNERYLLEVHAPPYKEKLFGTAGGR